MNRVIPLATLVLSALATSIASAQDVPTALQHDTTPLSGIEHIGVAGIDLAAVTQEDLEREASGLPPRYAIPREVSITPATHGTVDVLDDGRLLWRLAIDAPGAANINLGFTTYDMPEGGQLMLYSADAAQVIRPFTHEDNASHGELWTPPVLADAVVLELTIPRDLFGDLALELTQIGYGYRGFGSKAGGQESGSCNVDVVCSDGDLWRNEIPSVGVISLGGGTFCTGFMVNNTSNDRTPYFMTANHCGIGSGNAASLVVFWNYETSVCDATPDGVLSDFNTGSFFRSSYSASDFTLVELDSDPNPAYEVTFAGWNRSGLDDPGAIAIHHPSTDEKAISFEFQPTTVTSYLGTTVPGNGTHVRVDDWDTGTTEPGSSGSPLFNPAHQVVGQLHGGFAACGNNSSDWYGAFAVSWNGGGSANSRLSDWLDAAGTGAMSVDTLGAGMAVTPTLPVLHEGPVGGPFSNSSVVYTLTNNGDAPINYQVSLAAPTGLLLIDGGTAPLSGSLAALGGSVQVTASLDPSASGNAAGLYTGSILIEDTSNAVINTRDHSLEVGRTTVASLPMDVDPGWAEGGAWEFGTPSGLGGAFGNPDPTAGATGTGVMAYNLLGDYRNNEVEKHVTSTPFDLSGLTGAKVSFQRWLNVDQSSADHAYFRVSTDGTNFTDVWENTSAVTESAWSEQEYDISAIADGQSTVYLRWTMGSTNANKVYSGWNVDDVEITGYPSSPFVNYDAGSAGTGGFVPSLTGSGDTSIGGSFDIDIDQGVGGAFGAVALGFNRANLPAFGGSLLVDPPLQFLYLGLSGAAGAPGAGSFSVTTSFTDPGLAGITFQMQAILEDAGAVGGYSLSQGLETTIGF